MNSTERHAMIGPFVLVLLNLVAAMLVARDARAQTTEEIEALHALADAALEKLSALADRRALKMLEDLEHRNPERRREAAEYLGDLEVAEAAPRLAILLSDRHVSVRVAASRALWQIGDPGAEPAREALEAALSGEEGRVRINAAGALWRLGVSPHDLIEHLRSVFSDEILHGRSCYTRVNAANLMWRMGVPPTELLGVYRHALDEPSAELRAFTLEQILDRDEKPSEFTPLMLASLGDPDETVRIHAAIWLDLSGDDSPQVIAALRAATRDRSSAVRSVALAALGNVSPEVAAATASAAETDLLKGLRDRKAHVRASAARSLGEIPASSADAVAGLIAALSDKKNEVRAAAAEALGEIGEPAKSAIPHLQALWEDRSLYFTIRHAAGRSLGKLGAPVDWSSEG